MQRHSQIVIILLFSALIASCSGKDSGGNVLSSDGGVFVAGTGGPESDGTADLPTQTAPVMDVGNPEEESAQGPLIDDPRLRRLHEDKRYGVSIAYPADWTVTENERNDRIDFVSPDKKENVGATFIVSETSFEAFLDEANPAVALEPVAARGFDAALSGTREDGNGLHFEEYAGKAADGKTLIVVLSGNISGIRSPWLRENAIATISGREPGRPASAQSAQQAMEGVRDFMEKHPVTVQDAGAPPRRQVNPDNIPAAAIERSKAR